MSQNVDKDLADALNTLSTSTGDVLLPKKITAGIRRFVDTYSPLYAVTPRKPYDTKFYEYRAVTGLPTAAAKAEGQIDDVSHGTYEKEVLEMKWITSTGQVTGPEIDASRGDGGVDAWQTEVGLHSTAVINKIEALMVAGDASTTATEFSGFDTLITQEVDGAGAALSLAMLDEAIEVPFKEPTHMAMGRAHLRRIGALLQAQQRFNDRTEVAAGFNVASYANIPMLKVNRAAETALGNTILLPDMDNAYMVVLRDLTFEKLAKTDDSENFYIRAYMALAVEGTDIYHAKISNVLSAPVATPPEEEETP